MIYNQRDPQWNDQRLGTRDGWTIGMYGCYVAAQAMVSTHFQHNVTPADMDNIFTDNGLYYNEAGVLGGRQAGLCWDGMLARVYPDISFSGTYHCESFPCDLNQLLWSNQWEHEAIIEVDFDHDPTDGIQTHFVRFSSYDPATGVLLIDDPWYGDQVNFADRYGDPTVTIQKIVRYSGPSLPLPPAPVTPEPEPEAPAHPAPSQDNVSEPEPQAPSEPVVPSQPVSPIPSLPDSSANSPDDTHETPPATPRPESASATPPRPQSTITTPPVKPKIKLDMSKFLSRKFLLTLLGVVLAIGGYVSGAISAGETLTSATFLVGLYNVIQGLIEHKQAVQN